MEFLIFFGNGCEECVSRVGSDCLELTSVVEDFGSGMSLIYGFDQILDKKKFVNLESRDGDWLRIKDEAKKGKCGLLSNKRMNRF